MLAVNIGPMLVSLRIHAVFELVSRIQTDAFNIWVPHNSDYVWGLPVFRFVKRFHYLSLPIPALHQQVEKTVNTQI